MPVGRYAAITIRPDGAGAARPATLAELRAQLVRHSLSRTDIVDGEVSTLTEIATP